MKLRIPEVISEDKYYDAVIQAVGNLLEGYHIEIKQGDKSVLSCSKDELLLRSQSLGISEIFKKIPIERGRQLLNEFNYLIKSKGSEQAIIRMIQIYLGCVKCELDYKSVDRSYDINLIYGEIAGTNSYLVNSLYDAVKYVNPVGRRLGTMNLLVEPILVVISSSQILEAQLRYRSLYGSSVRDLSNKDTVGSYRKGFRVYPKEVSRDSYNTIYPWSTDSGIRVRKVEEVL